MTNFDAAFDKTMGHEGGYANDPRDFGGETYRGIARRFHPGWRGWQIVDDTFKSEGGAIPHAELDPLVRSFYKVQFWDRIQGGMLGSQRIAEELFDTAVNMGPGRAVEFLQVALNALNRGDRAVHLRYFEDVVEDGDIGPQTLEALQVYLSRDPEHYLMTLLNVQQGAHYLRRMRAVKSQERFARGWLSRVELTRGNHA